MPIKQSQFIIEYTKKIEMFTPPITAHSKRLYALTRSDHSKKAEDLNDQSTNKIGSFLNTLNHDFRGTKKKTTLSNPL